MLQQSGFKLWSMASLHRLFAILSVCGFAASILIYITSFSGVLVDRVFPLFVPLLLGWMVLLIPMYALEYPASRTPSFIWKFARGMPNWVAPLGAALSVIGVAHLVWFGVHCGVGVPAIVDGQYVLDSRGRILKVLTQAEYLTLRAAGLRASATIMLSFYFAPMAYWWFRRKGQQVALD
jgi:hypothetical protein